LTDGALMIDWWCLSDWLRQTRFARWFSLFNLFCFNGL